MNGNGERLASANPGQSRPGKQLSDLSAYTRQAVWLHWVMAAMLVGTFALGTYMVDLKFSPEKLSYYSYHKWIGVVAFGLAVLRLAWRLGHRPPQHLPSLPRWQVAAAGAVHALLYVLMIAIPLSGWLYSSAAGVPTVPFGIPALQLPDLLQRDREVASSLKFVHQALNYGLAALVTVHTAAALLHFIQDPKSGLQRMGPARK